MPKRSLDLPQDVIEILTKLRIASGPAGTGKVDIAWSVCHLARSYDSMMAEQGGESQPVELPPSSADVSRTDPLDMVDGATRDSIPSAEDIQRQLDAMSAPRGSLQEVVLRVHDKSLPRGSDGLVDYDYIVASNVPVVREWLTDDTMDEATAALRMTAIRETLSKLPEDIWSGDNVPALVDKCLLELKQGRRPTGKKL